MAAASLIIDYILTVAVSIAAGIAAVTSAIPALFPHREALCLIAIFVVVVLNLRGVRESGRVFAVPTYLLIGSFFLMIGTGLMQLSMGTTPTTHDIGASGVGLGGVSVFLIIRAFSSGCTALTGVEVISNGVSAFKKPEPHNAAVTMPEWRHRSALNEVIDRTFAKCQTCDLRYHRFIFFRGTPYWTASTLVPTKRAPSIGP